MIITAFFFYFIFKTNSIFFGCDIIKTKKKYLFFFSRFIIIQQKKMSQAFEISIGGTSEEREKSLQIVKEFITRSSEMSNTPVCISIIGGTPAQRQIVKDLANGPNISSHEISPISNVVVNGAIDEQIISTIRRLIEPATNPSNTINGGSDQQQSVDSGSHEISADGILSNLFHSRTRATQHALLLAALQAEFNSSMSLSSEETYVPKKKLQNFHKVKKPKQSKAAFLK